MLCNKEILIAVYDKLATDVDEAKYKDPIHFSDFDDLRVDIAFKQGYFCKYHDKDKNKWKTLTTYGAWSEDDGDFDSLCWLLKHHIKLTKFNKLWR